MGRPAFADDEIERQRERIAEIATGLFAEHGYAGVTLRSIAQQLGCSPMTPYRYFSGKEHIFADVRRRAYVRFAEAEESAADAQTDARLKLGALGHAYVEFGLTQPDAYRLMFSLAQPDPDAFPELRAAEERAWQPIRDAIAGAVDAGVLQGDVDILAHVFWSGVHGIVSLHVAGKLDHGTQIEALVAPMLLTLFEGNAP